MKQLYIALFSLALPALAAQAADEVHYLREIRASKGTETFLYDYDDAGRLAGQVHINAEDPAFSTRYEYSYNDAGQQVLEVMCQNLKQTEDPGEYVLVGRIEYTFDAEGRVSERTVYNDLGSGLELTSVFHYEYGAGGRLDRISIVPAGTEEVAQVFDFDYDAQGREIARSVSLHSSLLSKVTYSYDDATGKVKQQINYTYYPAENRLGVDLYVDYLYDSLGRLSSIDQYDTMRQMLLRQLKYTYDDEAPFTMAQAVFPANYEIEMFGSEVPYFTLTTEPMTGYEEGAYNEFSGQCELNDIYTFTYRTYPSDEPEPPVGIEAIDADSAVEVAISGGRIIIEGAEASQSVSLTNAAGRTVYAGPYGSGIAAGHLAPGVYILTTEAGSVKIAK